MSEFKHKVVVESGIDFGDYTILSPDADRAALEELQSIGTEIGAAFNDYFNATFGLTAPFSIQWNADGVLSATGAGALGPAVDKVLQDMNRRLASDDPMNDEGFDDTVFDDDMPDTLKEVTEKFVRLAEARDKLHDPAFENAGMTFTINPR